MFPIGHLALAYLVYALYARVRDVRLPHGLVLVVLLVASQLPDLVDKPLAYFDLLVSGRSLGHSFVVLFPLLLVAGVVLARFRRRELWPPLCIGVISHILGDLYRHVLAGEWSELRFLLWPIVPPIDYSGDAIPPWIRLLDRQFGLGMRFQLLLAVIAGIIWAWSRRRRAIAR